MPRNDGRIEPGQKLTQAISARAWNRAQQAADIVLGANPGLAAGESQGTSSPYTWIYAKNTTGVDLDQWGVMKIDGLQITPTASPNDRATTQFKSMPVATGVAWDSVSATARDACVAIEPIKSDAIGRVAVAGVVQVQPGDIHKLGTVAVLWRNSEWALVRLGTPAVRLGKTTAAWLRNTSHSVEIWNNGDPLDEEISSPLVTVTAYNKCYDVAACVWVLIAQDTSGRWYLVEAATPDPSEGGCKAPNIGGHDLTTVTGYASNKKQALTHDENACLKWVDIEDCA